MPLHIATIRAELTGAPSYRIASSPGTPFAILSMGPMHLTSDDPGELRRLADVAANAADVLRQAQAEARRSQAHRVKSCPVPHEAVKLSSHWPVLPFVGYQDDGAGGQLELRTCDCGTTLARQVEAGAMAVAR